MSTPDPFQLVNFYARKIAQSPHTGDTEQDTATYKFILEDMLGFYNFLGGHEFK